MFSTSFKWGKNLTIILSKKEEFTCYAISSQSYFFKCTEKNWKEIHQMVTMILFDYGIVRNSFFLVDTCTLLLLLFSHSVMSNSFNPMDCSMPGFPVLHHLPEFAQTHVHWVDDAIQPSHPLLPPSPLALNFSQYQGLFRWVSAHIRQPGKNSFGCILYVKYTFFKRQPNCQLVSVV